MTRAKVISLPLVVLLACPAAAGASALLRLDGLGPLKLGMKRSTALRSGWLAHRAKGCELDTPRPITYTLTGPKAPTGVTGLVNFQHRKLVSISVTRGVHTKAGVVVGRTTSSQMVADYKSAGYSATAAFNPTFGGTFTTVTQGTTGVIQGFGAKRIVTLLAIPAVQVCD